jgi:hypothetical protein
MAEVGLKSVSFEHANRNGIGVLSKCCMTIKYTMNHSNAPITCSHVPFPYQCQFLSHPSAADILTSGAGAGAGTGIANQTLGTHLQLQSLRLRAATLQRPSRRNRPFPPQISPTFAMAAAIKALNAKIRSNKYTDYVCSTRTFSPGSRCRRARTRCDADRQRAHAAARHHTLEDEELRTLG